MDEIEVIDPEPHKNPGVVMVMDRQWEPPALAQLSEDEFEKRIKMAQLQIERMGEIQRSIMTENVDYGRVPGVPKPFLFQPGAQVLNHFTGYVPTYTVQRMLGDGIELPAIHYEIRCRLEDASGAIISEGMGSANSHERKHRYRHGDKACPNCGQTEPFMRAKKTDKKQAYFCWKTKGGCEATYDRGTPEAKAIDAQSSLVENPDPHDADNTLLKMSCKRALVAATVNAHACSGQFSQDDPPPAGRPEDPAPDAGASQTAAAQQKGRERRQAPSRGDRAEAPATDSQRKMCWAKLKHRLQELGLAAEPSEMASAEDRVLDGLDAETFGDLKFGQVDTVLLRIGGLE